MTKFKSSNIYESIANAIHGLNLALFSQRNFACEVVISVITFVLTLVFHFSITDICITVVMIALVLICELINSVVEFTLDAVYKNNYSKLVEMAKDMSAGMVLLSVIFSVIIGILLFGKYILIFIQSIKT